MTSSPPQNDFDSAVEFLRHEASAISDAADRLDHVHFVEAVRVLTECSGAVRTTGMGTSGIVARKVAATLTSTGTSATYVHPTDALHGGLGVIGRDDIVIAISNSGETDELLMLLPYVKSRGARVIGIVGNTASTLGKAASVALDASAASEAGPFGVVPTASVVVALAIGDALALSVMQAKGVTREAFAANHPSGRLGRRLTLRVRDVMHAGVDNPVLRSGTRLMDTLTALTEGGLGAVTIVGPDDQLLGIVTDGDVRRALQRLGPTGLASICADEIMTRDPVLVNADAMAFDALRLMEDRPSQIAVLPVVEDGRCIGLVRLHDLVRIGL